MFNKKTVIIVGAGASKDFYLPTEADVYSQLLKEEVSSYTDNYSSSKDLFDGGFS